jgi:Flp pilus assembly protein TadD
VGDAELIATWLAMSDVGHHEESLRMLERLLDAHPDDAALHLLLSATLLATERDAESLHATHSAIRFGWDDPAILTRAASNCFYAGDLSRARACIDRAKRIKPRKFLFDSELKELDRNLRRREKGRDQEERLSVAFNADPRDLETTIDFARRLAFTGRSHAAYHVVSRGLIYHPDDRVLKKIEEKLRDEIPDAVRVEAEEWAKSGKSSRVSR